ncbi:glycosyltransferase [Flavobacterium sp.]|uniref:glycosyltransferase family 2 protein n=1 Tax=Flavobacterium sp. TaxID=239 RepID=UPI00286E7F42|nr:glycosyltransferase [Flavobacterium sp.]
MQDNPLVSIICLCYNHEKYVVEALNSVINQSYKNIQLIIVDDCSTDSSVAVIQNWLLAYPEIQFISNHINLGNTKSFNIALQSVTGAYIIDLAADDILMPNCVALQLECFTKTSYKNTGVVYGNVELITENGDFDSYYFPVNEQKKVIEKRNTGNIYSSILAGGNSLCSVSAMSTRKVFDELNGYDENLYYEDLDFWIRVARNYDFDFIDKILVQKRVLKNSLGADFHKKNSAQSRKINHSTYQILKKTLLLNKTNEENKAVLKRIHYEMILNFKGGNYGLLLKYLFLEIQFRSKSI